MRRSSLSTALVLLATVTAISGPGTAVFAQAPALVVTATGRAVTDADALAAREVVISPAAIESAAEMGAELQVEFLPGAAFTLTTTQVVRRASGVALFGTVSGDGLGTWSLAIEHGQVSGGVWARGSAFGLTPTGRVDGSGLPLCIAREIRPEAVRRCAMTGTPHGGPEPVSARDLLASAALRRALGEESPAPPLGGLEGPAGVLPPLSGACSCGDDQSIVDVLVAYTPAALAGAGGLAALQARISDAFAATNAAFVNSGVTTGPGGQAVNRLQVRMVGLVPIAYDEVAPQWLNHLERVTSPNDGIMDGIHAMRTSANADLVSLVVEDARFTGGAAYYAVYTEQSAFSVMNWRAFGGGSLTFAHELGHNFGCAHDRGNSGFSPFQYAWGHSFSSGGTSYGTIMSYTGTVPVASFSNPLLVHGPTGQPLGAPLSSPLPTSNALAIAQTRWTLASYRNAPGIVDCNGNGLADDADIAAGRSTDANSNCRPDECEYRVYVDSSNTGPVDGLSWATAYTDLGEALAFASMNCSNVSEVWVANGVYRIDQQTNDRFARLTLRSGLALVGGFQGASRPGGGETSINQRIFVDGLPAPASASIITGEIGNPLIATDNSFNLVVIENTDETAVLDGFTLSGAYQDFEGPAVFLSNSGARIRRCTIIGNRGGSAVAVTGLASSVAIETCRFDSNIALGSGGGLGVRDGAAATIDGSIFRTNTAPFGGAGAVQGGASTTFTGCTFEGNTAQFNSGAVDAFSSAILVLNDCAFRDNVAVEGGGGAVIAHTLCTLLVNNTLFDNNAAENGIGGGVWIEFSDATLNNSVFTANRSSFGGGGVSVRANGGSFMAGCTFAGNTSMWGGGVAAADSTVTLERSLLTDNRAQQFNGGAIDAFNSTVHLTSTRLLNNTATDSGGGLWLGNGASGTLIGSTLAGNHAAGFGGGTAMFDSTLVVASSILALNTSEFGDPLENQTTVFSGERTATYSCISGSTGVDLGGVGNIDADPGFINLAAGDVALSAGSPCIDAGDSSAFPPGAISDGVGNARFVDDLATADTGISAGGPVADMGALEFTPGPEPCALDFNQDGFVEPGDLDEFITAFFSDFEEERARCDFNHDGFVEPGDLDEYITGYFGGC
ncbi:MAG: M12 family metallo-peptidase [Phycisphaerales bacterium]